MVLTDCIELPTCEIMTCYLASSLRIGGKCILRLQNVFFQKKSWGSAQ